MNHCFLSSDNFLFKNIILRMLLFIELRYKFHPIETEAGFMLAKAGFAVYAIDFEGHGKSSGLQGYIPSFDALVNDCSDHFTSICG